MSLKDTLTALTTTISTEHQFLNTINSRVLELKTRDEELVAKVQSQLGDNSLVDLTGRHSITDYSSLSLKVVPNLYDKVSEYYIVNTITLPETFGSTNIAHLYSFDGNTLIFGSESTTYTYSVTSNSIIDSRPRNTFESYQGNLTYGYFRNYLVNQMYDGSIINFRVPNSYGSGVRPIINSSDVLLTITKPGELPVNITGLLPYGEQLLTVAGSSDGHTTLVMTAPAGSSPGSPTGNAWYKIYWDGTSATLSDSGTIASSAGVLEYYGVGLSCQNFEGSLSLEENGTDIWLTDGTYDRLRHFRIYPDKVMRLESILPFTIPGDTIQPASSISHSGRLASIILNKLTITRRTGDYYTEDPGVIDFTNPGDHAIVNDSMSDFGFGLGDFSISFVVKVAAGSKYMLLYTDSFSISLENWSTGKAVVAFKTLQGDLYTNPLVSPDKYQRITLERISGNITLTVNKISGNTDSFNRNLVAPTVMRVGSHPTDTSYQTVGEIVYIHITKASRNSANIIPHEPLRGSSDSLWSDTVLYVVADVSSSIPRRELVVVKLEGEVMNKILVPSSWEVAMNNIGTFTINHDLGNTRYIVIPSPGIGSVSIHSKTESSFKVNTFNRQGVYNKSNFSCLVIQY